MAKYFKVKGALTWHLSHPERPSRSHCNRARTDSVRGRGAQTADDLAGLPGLVCGDCLAMRSLYERTHGAPSRDGG